MIAMSSALAKIETLSDEDVGIAVVLRMFSLSQKNKPIHMDKVAVWYLARYYNNRSALSQAEQDAISATPLLTKISKLQESSEELRNAIQSKKTINSELNKPLE